PGYISPFSWRDSPPTVNSTLSLHDALPIYGFNRERVMNASVEFDVETLRPTYRLLLGIPGRSNAFEISKRLGLSDALINDAENHMGADSQTVDTMITSLEDARHAAEQD